MFKNVNHKKVSIGLSVLFVSSLIYYNIELKMHDNKIINLEENYNAKIKIEQDNYKEKLKIQTDKVKHLEKLLYRLEDKLVDAVINKKNSSNSKAKKVVKRYKKRNYSYIKVKYWNYIKKYSKLAGVDPYLIAGIISRESGFRPNVKSGVGCIGLGQLDPKTYRDMVNRYGLMVKDIYDIKSNILVTAFYVRWSIKAFKKLDFALAHYNNGKYGIKNYKANKFYITDYVEDVKKRRDYIKNII